MKKKFIIIAFLLVILLFSFFMYEKGIYYFINPKITSTLLIESSYSNYVRDKEYYGILIYDDGSIYTFRDDIGHIVGKKWYKVRANDLRKLKDSINDLDGEFEINSSFDANLDRDTIYVYRNQEKIRIYDNGDIKGKNNSKACDKILKIIHKYL